MIAWQPAGALAARHRFRDLAAPESGNAGRLAYLAQLLHRRLTLLTQMYRALNSPGVDAEEAELVVTFDGRDVRYGFGELDELVLAYATTIHKSQGSEYPAVVIPLVTQHYMMLARNLLYTGVTRGKRLVVLLGQSKALAIAVRSQGSRRRWSELRDHLTSVFLRKQIS
jgi:hypothetical protein